MSFSGWFLFFITILLISVLFLPLTVRIKLHNLRDDNNIFLTFRLMLFRSVPVYATQKRLGEEAGEKKKAFPFNVLFKGILDPEIYLSSHKLLGHIGYYLLRVGGALNWHEMTVLLKVGTGDAASTGISMGMIRSLCGIITHMLQKHWRFRDKDPLILSYPYFLQKKLTFHIIVECSAGIAPLLYRIFLPGQTNKEVKRRWQKNIQFKR